MASDWALMGLFRRGSRWPARVLTLVVVVLGLATSLGLGYALTGTPRRVAADSIEGRADIAEQSVEAEVRRYADSLTTVAAGLGNQNELDAAHFTAATAPLSKMELAGATSIGFIVPSDDASIPTLQQYWRRHGVPNLTLQPYGSGEHLFSIMTASLDESPAPSAGTDASQAAAPTAALYEARRTNRVTVSDTYQLIRDSNLPVEQRQLSFVLAAPVYSLASDGSSVFRGWLLMGLRGQDFFGSLMQTVSGDLVDLTLRAQNAEHNEVQVAALRSGLSGERDLSRTRIIEVAQQRWTLELDSIQSALPGGSQALPKVVTITGALLTLLLAVLVYVLGTSRSRALLQVWEATQELHAAEAEALRKSSLMAAILDGISDGVGVVDSNGAFVLHNPAAKQMLGVQEDTSDPAEWQDHYGIFLPDGSTPFPEAEIPLMRALAGESVTGVELFIRNAANPEGLSISVSARPLLLHGESGAVAVFHDVTATKRYQRELSGFAGVVAHDLKSPLAIIRGYAEILGDELSPDLSVEAMGRCEMTLGKLNSGVERMQSLIDDLLAYTASQDAPLNESQVDLETLTTEVVANRIEGCGNSRDRLPRVHAGALPVVYADTVLVRQVLDNLIGNALKYTQPGSVPYVDISATERDGWARIEIADRGIGIPAGQHRAIFSGFHRAHADGPYPGTGLGLAICARIVQRHGGTIGVLDNPGGGSRFYFTLPLAVAEVGLPVPVGASAI